MSDSVGLLQCPLAFNHASPRGFTDKSQLKGDGEP